MDFSSSMLHFKIPFGIIAIEVIDGQRWGAVSGRVYAVTGIHFFLSGNHFRHDAASTVRQLLDTPQMFRRTTELSDSSQFLISRSSQCPICSRNGNLKVCI